MKYIKILTAGNLIDLQENITTFQLKYKNKIVSCDVGEIKSDSSIGEHSKLTITISQVVLSIQFTDLVKDDEIGEILKDRVAIHSSWDTVEKCAENGPI